MSTVLNLLPAVACAALMGIPMTISRARGWLHRHRRAPGSPAAPTPGATAGIPHR
jgi:hypothetical protein